MFIKRVGICRGQSQKLFNKRVTLDVGKYCFSNRVCDEWNRLPGEIGNARSVDSFNFFPRQRTVDVECCPCCSSLLMYNRYKKD